MARRTPEPTLTALLARYGEAADHLHVARIAVADAEREYLRREGMVRATTGGATRAQAQSDLRAASHALAEARLTERDALLAIRRARVSLLIRRHLTR